jgi:uncharacterized membrane protein YiaA
MKRTIGYAATAFCVIFAVLTLVSSAIQLWQGQPTDTNLHILNRAALCAIGVLMMTLIIALPGKSAVLRYVIAYAVSMVVVFFYVWVEGHFEELHPNAYRDIFLNFTIVFVVVAVAVGLWQRHKQRQQKGDF